MNPYAYAVNNPLQFIDVNGFDPLSPALLDFVEKNMRALYGPAFEGESFSTRDAAPIYALTYIIETSIAEDIEYGGMICRDSNGNYFATWRVRGTRDSCTPSNSPCPRGSTTVAAYHTHGAPPKNGGNYKEKFSSFDESQARTAGIDFYLGTPLKVYKRFNHITGKSITLMDPIQINSSQKCCK
jgi:hypothetical protein